MKSLVVFFLCETAVMMNEVVLKHFTTKLTLTKVLLYFTVTIAFQTCCYISP